MTKQFLIRQECEKFQVPGATLSYSIWHILRQDKEFRGSPVADVSKGGLAFLTDKPTKPGRRISLFLKFSTTEAPLQLEGRVAYAVLESGISY